MEDSSPASVFLRSLTPGSASPVGRAAHIKAFVARLFLFQFGTLHSDFFTRLFQLAMVSCRAWLR